MLRGQFSVSFATRVVLGFLLMIALVYATLMMENAIKKESQKQTLVAVSEYVATNVFSTINYLSPGQSASQSFRVPMSRDYFTGQYSVRLEGVGGAAYVAVQSTKWPNMTARHPLFLNTSHLDMDTTRVFPPLVCIEASRNTTHYIMSLKC